MLYFFLLRRTLMPVASVLIVLIIPGVLLLWSWIRRKWDSRKQVSDAARE